MADRAGRRTSALDHDPWILVLLVVVFLVPAACVLWFTSQAVATQSSVARQRVLDAYRGQLRLVRSRIDARWEEQAARLQGDDVPERRFARLVLDQAADGVVLLHGDGTVAYPGRGIDADGLESDPGSDEGSASAVARAAQREVRSLLRRGDRDGALEVIGRYFPPGAVAGGRDPEGRLIAADQLLLEAQLSGAGTVRRTAAIERLAALLNDYAISLPSAQRLFLMGELRVLARNVWLPTEGALRLSTQIVEAGPPAPAPGGFQATARGDVWALPSLDGHAIGLYRTGRLEALLHDVLHEVAPEGIRFLAYPPGATGDAEAVAAGPWLPGWQLSFEPLDMAPFDAAVRHEVLTSLAVGFTALAVMTVFSVGAGRALRRQLRLARLKTDLVAAVSHELRTPVTSVGVLVDGLLADPDPDPAKTREYLQMVAAENARLGRLVENFLTFSRLERQAHHFVFSPVAPSAIVQAALDAVRDRLPAGCEIRVEVPPDLPAIPADRDALVTALVNLLDNAIKYTHTEKRIRVRAHREEDDVVLAVEDNGIGIPIREHRRIFRRFHRVDQRLARETGGVGLGLSIVALIVRAHGGTIDLTSESGAGSTFVLRLPCATGAAPA